MSGQETSTAAIWRTLDEHKKLLTDLDKRTDLIAAESERQRTDSKDLIQKLTRLEANVQNTNMQLSAKINSILTVGKTLMWVIPLTGGLTVAGMGAVVWLYQNFGA